MGLAQARPNYTLDPTHVEREGGIGEGWSCHQGKPVNWLLITGVIPRAVRQIFNGIEERKAAATERNEPQPQFELTAQFLEVGA